MKKKEISPIDRNVMKRIHEDSEFATTYFEELSERPIAVQRRIVRRLAGKKGDTVEEIKKLWQGKLAKEIHRTVLHAKRKGLI